MLSEVALVFEPQGTRGLEPGVFGRRGQVVPRGVQGVQVTNDSLHSQLPLRRHIQVLCCKC